MTSKYKVWRADEDMEDGKNFEAVDHEHAAKIWAEWNDGDCDTDGMVADGEPAEVKVLKEGDTEDDVLLIKVKGWITYEYSASVIRNVDI